MFVSLIALMFAVQDAPAETAQASPAPTPSAADEAKKPRKIYVSDSRKAATIEVEDPMQEICVRTPILGSRVKVRTTCQDQAAWKAYILAQEAMGQEWDKADPGVPIT